jgi:hypothetical protein
MKVPHNPHWRRLGVVFDWVVANRNGMTEGELHRAFDGAGLTSFVFKLFSTLTLHGAEGMLFVAKGVKPAI